MATGTQTKQLPRDATCELHGTYTSRHIWGQQWTICPVCADEAAAVEREAKAARDRALAQERYCQRLRLSGIPDRFEDRTLSAYRADSAGQRRALEFATAYAAAFGTEAAAGRGALFVGRPGTGKSHLAIGIGLQILDRFGVRYETTLRAVRRIKATWQRDAAESEAEAIRALTTPPLLILDEVGVQFGSQAERMLLEDIVDQRYAARRATLFVSNHPVGEVRDILGERIVDRMREDGAETIVFDWASHRGSVKS